MTNRRFGMHGPSFFSVLGRPRTAFVVGLTCLVGLTACDRPPSADGLPEWSPKDHDPNGATVATSPSGPRPKGNPDADAAQLAELTWSGQCALCHGALGRGDGPQGPMLKAPDLTRADWQDRVKDADIAATIVNGKNQMPKFDLSPTVVAALVKRIRKNRAP